MIETRAAVIGSGFGGLAAAVRLQALGVKTILFEARDKPGGRAYVYEDEGFTFDAGPTVITAPECLEEVFSAAGRRLSDYVELLPVKPFYRLEWEDSTSLDYAGTDAMRQQIGAMWPEDLAGYERFIEYSKAVFAKGYTELAAAPFLRFFDMVKVAPSLAKFRADRSVYQTVARFVKSEHLRQALSFHSLLVGGNPFETSSIYTLIHYLETHWGVFFPRGGTGALVKAWVRLFEELGGEVRLNSPVDLIEVERNGQKVRHIVTPRGGDPESFDLVISNADVHHTYSRLYRNEQQAQVTTKKLERAEWSMSLFVLYFGTDREYNDIAHHTVIFGPRYRELLQEIFHGAELPEDFSLYLHSPTVTDKTLAPPGCSGFYVLSPVPHLGHLPANWDELAPKYAEKILESLERYLPDLRQHVVTKRWFTPTDFQGTLSAYQGAAFSVAPTLTQSAWFRPHNKDPKIPGLYIVGAGTHPGAGLPGVVNSAKATLSVILEDFPELKPSGEAAA
ncbi:MAG: phytoene desaturase [Polyangiaceae bacterium]|nr:phytoene desaturase [Polyangiaceae bacterium]